MLNYQLLPFSVHAMRVRPCGPELDPLIAKVLSEALDPCDMDRVAVEEVDGYEVACFFVEAYKSNRIVSGLRSLGVLDTHRDLSRDILIGRSCGAEIDLTLIRYPGLVRSYRLCHLTIDDVLDKVNEAGPEALDEVDREVLARLWR